MAAKRTPPGIFARPESTLVDSGLAQLRVREGCRRFLPPSSGPFAHYHLACRVSPLGPRRANASRRTHRLATQLGVAGRDRTGGQSPRRTTRPQAKPPRPSLLPPGRFAAAPQKAPPARAPRRAGARRRDLPDGRARARAQRGQRRGGRATCGDCEGRARPVLRPRTSVPGRAPGELGKRGRRVATDRGHACRSIRDLLPGWPTQVRTQRLRRGQYTMLKRARPASSSRPACRASVTLSSSFSAPSGLPNRNSAAPMFMRA